jgi:hypothetical protein
VDHAFRFGYQLTADDERDPIAAAQEAEAAGFDVALADATPYLRFGTVDEIAEKLHACRERWGISYFTVRDRFAFPDVIDELR